MPSPDESPVLTSRPGHGLPYRSNQELGRQILISTITLVVLPLTHSISTGCTGSSAGGRGWTSGLPPNSLIAGASADNSGLPHDFSSGKPSVAFLDALLLRRKNQTVKMRSSPAMLIPTPMPIRAPVDKRGSEDGGVNGFGIAGKIVVYRVVDSRIVKGHACSATQAKLIGPTT